MTHVICYYVTHHLSWKLSQVEFEFYLIYLWIIYMVHHMRLSIATSSFPISDWFCSSISSGMYFEKITFQNKIRNIWGFTPFLESFPIPITSKNNIKYMNNTRLSSTTFNCSTTPLSSWILLQLPAWRNYTLHTSMSNLELWKYPSFSE